MYVIDVSDPNGMDYLTRALNIYEESGQTEHAALVHSRMGVALVPRSVMNNPSGAMEHYRKAEAILGKGAVSGVKLRYTPEWGWLRGVMLGDEGLAWSRAAWRSLRESATSRFG